jgi:hypothetical protein
MRVLSPKQKQSIFGEALKRVVSEAQARTGKFLSRLDRINSSGRRTRQQRWDALAAVAEPMLARLDLAQMTLGWLDNAGVFRLNRQRCLADDGGITESRLSRLLGTLDSAGYTRRKFKREYVGGRWSTRTLICITECFFVDLGLGQLFTKLRAKAISRRSVNASTGAVAAVTAIKRSAHSVSASPREKFARQSNGAAILEKLMALKAAHPELADDELTRLYRRLECPE